ncbi:MAG: hypothetical protein LC663_04200, partial [Actinobacteria bacterium]|nr:hypothetical protein [Actinomycetota bacterium]
PRTKPARERSASDAQPISIGHNALRRCIPELVRSGVATGRRNGVAVASIHLANLDDLIAEAGPGTAAHHLSDLMDAIARAFAAHDVAFIGSDVAPAGPRIVCATGVVRTRSNDDQRLLRALKELLEYPSAIDLRVGADRGDVNLRIDGTPTRRVLMIGGAPVDRATQHMSRAGRNEIVASEPLVGRLPRLAKAAQREGDAYRIAKATYTHRGVVNMLLNLGTLAFEHGDYEAARHYWEEGVSGSRRANATHDEALLLHRLAEVALAMRDPELAMVRCDQALELTRHLGDDIAAAQTLITLGLARSADGDTASARSSWLYAVELLGGRPDRTTDALAQARAALRRVTEPAAPPSDG